MPFYDYKCEKCGKIIEKHLTLSQLKTEVIKCECQQDAICHRVVTTISAPVFTGNGFHQTDYKK